MTLERLEEVCTQLYPNMNWKQSLADEMGVHITTVHRWIRLQNIPRCVELAMEGLLDAVERETVNAEVSDD